MSWVVACVLCTIGATGCGTLTRVSQLDAVAPDAHAVVPAEPSAAASSPVAVSDEPPPVVGVDAVSDTRDAAEATENADPVVVTAPTPPGDATDAQDVASTEDRFADTVALL